MYLPPNNKLCLYEVKHEEKWFFGFKHGNFKNLPKLHFRVTKKDTSLPFHFHVLNLFKLSWSNLGFDKIQMGKHMISDANIISKCGQTSL